MLEMVDMIKTEVYRQLLVWKMKQKYKFSEICQKLFYHYLNYSVGNVWEFTKILCYKVT